MNTNSQQQTETREDFLPASAEQRLKELAIQVPMPPEPFGAYVEAVQTGNLLFLSGMPPTEGRGAKFNARVGTELDVQRRVTRLISQRSTSLLSPGSILDR